MGTVLVILFVIVTAIIIYSWLNLKDTLEVYRSKSALDSKLGLPTIANNQIIIKKAYNTYYKSLSELKSQPTDANLKEMTLDLGREFSRLTRKFHGTDGVTIVDEVSIMNDINAACAGATVVSAKGATNSQIILERLAKLSELKEKNLISEQEHETKRQRILDEI